MSNNPETNGEYWLLDQASMVWPDHAMLLDVGANTGEWSLRALSLAKRSGRHVSIKAFEPCAGTRSVLTRRLTDQGDVEVVPSAVSSSDGEASFFSSGAGAGTNSLNAVSGPASERVPLVTIDTFAAQRGIERVWMLKIDTEGYDCSVLQGAGRMLREGRITVVQFEYNWRWLLNKASLMDVFALAKGTPYRVGKLAGRTIEFYDTWHPELDRFFENNYVLVLRGSPLEQSGRPVGFDSSNSPTS